MIIFDLMLVWLVITTITLLSGAKIMYNPKYSQVIMFIVIMYINLSNLVEGYNSISKLTIEDLINGIKILWCSEVGLWIKEAYYIDNTPEKVKKFMFEINWITDNWFDLENIIKI